jgi:uncharacterized protein with HEPN domain
MSKRDLRLYFDDILESIEAIEDYVTTINSFDDSAGDRKIHSATIRESENILSLARLLGDSWKCWKTDIQTMTGG